MPEVIKKPQAAPAKPETPKAPAKQKAAEPPREMKYPLPYAVICVRPETVAAAIELVKKLPNGEEMLKRAFFEPAITVERMKELLGWVEEVEGGEKFGADYLFTDGLGKKIRLTNNVTNRPIYPGVVDALRQEHLNAKWKFNGEPIIVGQYGSILNGQHTGISLITAEQERTSGKPDQVAHWSSLWPGPVTMEKIIVFGVPEDDATVNTMDTCKPRTLADVVYRSEYFKKMKPADRKVISRMTDYALRLVWDRTWVSADAFAPRRTHAEAIEFLNHHPKLLKAVKHVFEEDKGGKISKFVSPGYASAMCYLMAASDTKLESYLEKGSEKACDFSQADKAEEFWMLLGDDKAGEFSEVRVALGALNSEDTGAGGSLLEKIAVLAKAWAIWSEKKAFKDGDLVVYTGSGEKRSIRSARLEYDIDNDGIRHLADYPIFGGIDRGRPAKEVKTKAEPAATADNGDAAPKSGGSAQDKLAASRDKLSKDQSDLLAKLRAENPGRILVFQGKDDYKAWDDDAAKVAEATHCAVQIKYGLRCCVIHKGHWDEALPGVRSLGNVSLVTPGSNGAVVVQGLPEAKESKPDGQEVKEEKKPAAPAKPGASPAKPKLREVPRKK